VANGKRKARETASQITKLPELFKGMILTDPSELTTGGCHEIETEPGMVYFDGCDRLFDPAGIHSNGCRGYGSRPTRQQN
jgi:hypothetical protein